MVGTESDVYLHPISPAKIIAIKSRNEGRLQKQRYQMEPCAQIKSIQND